MGDQELVKRILGGDQPAMRDLVIKYQDLVVNTCFQVLHNRDDAEDVAQEVFLEAYRSMARLRNESCLSYWLYRISLNKSINVFRKNRFFRRVIRLDHPDRDGDGENGMPGEALEGSPHDTIEENEKLEVVTRMIDTLPARQQKAFILHHMERLSYKEIGQILNLSHSSVESLIFRARTTLKCRCQDYYQQKNLTK